MTLKPRFLLDRLQSSLWVVPLGVVLAMIVAAQTLMALDARFNVDLKLMSGAGVDAARSMLQAVASSMITVAALVFSLTLAVLAQVSAQYTSRVIRNFLRDRLNQLVLGIFLGIYAYCLVALHGIGGEEGDIPALTALGGFIAALAGVVFLVFSIHHLTRSMQIENILASIEDEALPVFERIYPEDEADDEGGRDDAMPSLPENGAPVRANSSGYIQDINVAALLDVAETLDTVIHVPHRVGDFIAPGQILAWLDERAPADEKFAEAVRDAFSTGRMRSIQQDPAFGLRQFVDVALKALSPGINETTNAVMVLDRIGVLLRVLAERPLPARERLKDGRLRLVVERADMEDLIRLSFDQIGRCGSDNPAVLGRMLSVLAELTAVACNARRQALLRAYAQRVMAAAERNVEDPGDLAWLRGEHRRLGFAAPSKPSGASTEVITETTSG